jgi:putative tryptophan/tyrosine transport system substrate-binding protein
MTRVAVLRDSANPAQTAQFGVIQAVAAMLRVEVTPVDMRDAGEIEQAVETFARSPHGGLIVVAGGASIRHRDLIVTLAAQRKLPAVYWEHSSSLPPASPIARSGVRIWRRAALLERGVAAVDRPV